MNELKKKYLNDLYERRRENNKSIIKIKKQIELLNADLELLNADLELLKYHILSDGILIDKIVFENENRR